MSSKRAATIFAFFSVFILLLWRGHSNATISDKLFTGYSISFPPWKLFAQFYFDSCMPRTKICIHAVYMLKHLNMNQNCISKQILDLIQNQQKNQIQCVFFSRPFLSPCYSSLRPFSKPCPFKGHFMLKPFICKIFANIVVLYWYLSKTVLGTINSSQITKKRQPSSLIDFCAIKMIDWFMCHKNVSWTLESSSTQCI